MSKFIVSYFKTNNGENNLSFTFKNFALNFLKWIPKRSKRVKNDESDYNKKFNNFNKYF